MAPFSPSQSNLFNILFKYCFSGSKQIIFSGQSGTKNPVKSRVLDISTFAGSSGITSSNKEQDTHRVA